MILPFLAAAAAAIALSGAETPVEPPRPPASPVAKAARVPYQQALANGTLVNWLDGQIVVVGRTRIVWDPGANPVLYSKLQAEAEREGYGRIAEALKGIPLDSSTTLGAQPDLLDRYHAAIARKPAETVVQDQGGLFQVRVKSVLWGAGGLLSLVLPDRAAPEPKAPATTAVLRLPAAGWGFSAPDVRHATLRARSGPHASGVVIDARPLDPNAPLAPALLPRVMDTAGRIVFGVDSVDLDFARE